jgi:hypothetical protein
MAAALGDDYPAVPSLVITSVVTVVTACFGCPFPTSVYIGVSVPGLCWCCPHRSLRRRLEPLLYLARVPCPHLHACMPGGVG